MAPSNVLSFGVLFSKALLEIHGQMFFQLWRIKWQLSSLWTWGKTSKEKHLLAKESSTSILKKKNTWMWCNGSWGLQRDWLAFPALRQDRKRREDFIPRPEVRPMARTAPWEGNEHFNISGNYISFCKQHELIWLG